MSLQAIADPRSFEEIVAAVRDAKTAERLGIAALDDPALHRLAGIEPWSVATVLGRTLTVDEAAGSSDRCPTALSRGRARCVTTKPGDAAVTKEQLLVRLARRRRGSPRSPTPDRAVRALRIATSGGSMRGWIPFIAIRDASHLHEPLRS